MAIVLSCNTASLASYTPTAENPWDARKVKNLYRRLGFGATQVEIQQALAKTPQQFIDDLIDEAISLPVMEAQPWSYQGLGELPNEDMNSENIFSVMMQSIDDFQTQNLRARLVMFWSNHFVTQLDTYFCGSWLYQYYILLQGHAIGNFKDFVYDVGITPAMLAFLNGIQNTKYSPNENYARELYELFTLGEGNGYTQQDIVETSRALTGYNDWSDWCGTVSFNTDLFDDESKVIFEQEGNWGYDDVIRILFEQKASLIAPYICRKLYIYFISPEVKEDIISQMATIFIDNDFELAPVLRTLFKSEHFFDNKNFGAMIKSPFDLTIGFLKETAFSVSDDNREALPYFNETLGQYIFSPVDVAGWQGDRDWISSSTLTGRWQILEYMCWWAWNYDEGQFRTLAVELSDNSNDPYEVTKAIIDRFVPEALFTPEDYTIATDIFKGDVPENYYETGQWNLYWDSVPWQVINLFFFIIKMPEFQLK